VVATLDPFTATAAGLSAAYDLRLACHREGSADEPMQTRGCLSRPFLARPAERNTGPVTPRSFVDHPVPVQLRSARL
jgi:hypothetical protein